MTSLSPDAAMTRADRARRRRMRRGRFLRVRRTINSDTSMALFTGTLGAILVLFAMPRVTAEILSVGASPVREQIRLGRSVTPKDLAEAATDLNKAILVDRSDALRLTDRGLIALIEAESLGLQTEIGKSRLESGMKFLERGLSENPANSYAWARLAWARHARDGGPSPGVLHALRMSYRTGPFADQIMSARANLALLLWERLDPDLQKFAKRELVYLWTSDVRDKWDKTKQIIRDVCAHNRAFILAEALRESPAATAEFDRLYPFLMTPAACRENAAKDAETSR